MFYQRDRTSDRTSNLKCRDWFVFTNIAPNLGYGGCRIGFVLFPTVVELQREQADLSLANAVC